jgi:hypothetical protein
MITPYSSFEYQYRDGGNFRSRNFVLLEGKANSDIIKNSRSCRIDGMWFIAEQVGIPVLF